jgi:hypothetical protein
MIYAAATGITERATEPGRTVENTRNIGSWKIRIQRKISNWRKDCPYLLNQVQVQVPITLD